MHEHGFNTEHNRLVCTLNNRMHGLVMGNRWSETVLDMNMEEALDV